MAPTLETLLHHLDAVQYALLLLGGGLLALLERGWPRRQGQRGPLRAGSSTWACTGPAWRRSPAQLPV